MGFFDEIKDVIHEAKTLFPDENAGNGTMDDNETKTVYLKCPYCGAENKIIWKEGVLPKCPYCGGEYDSSQVEEQRKAMLEAAEKRRAAADAAALSKMNAASEPKVPWHKKFRIQIILGIMMLILAIFAAIYMALGGKPMSMHMDSNFEIHIGETSQLEDSGNQGSDMEPSTDQFPD